MKKLKKIWLKMKEKINYYFLYFSILITNLMLWNPIEVLADKKDGNDMLLRTDARFWDAYNAFFKEYKLYLNIFMGCTMLINILVLTYHITKLGVSSNNPQKKSECMQNIVIASICVALQGAVVMAMWILYYLSNPLISGAAS